MKKYKIKGENTKSVLDILRNDGVKIAADCGGRGTCGKCKVYVNNKEVLACKTFVNEDIEVEIPIESSLDNLCVEVIKSSCEEKEASCFCEIKDKHGYSMAVDIGTTTVAAALLDYKFNIVNTCGTSNSQKNYGSDVISRVEAAAYGKLDLLKSAIRKDVIQLREKLAQMSKIDVSHIDRIVISANTVMEHIFMGYSCDGFKKAPYYSVNMGEISEGEYELLPCITPFVGADILSGIAVVDMDQNELTTALIDLGTNGEMAIGNKDKILVASTAAGPVFEGGNIRCGMSATDGAIDKVDISGLNVFYRTIGDEEPLGICAAGLIDAIYGFKKNRAIGSNGVFSEEWQDEGFYIDEKIYISQDDINNFLMAKSAIVSGFSVLCSKLNIKYEDIDKLYVAGGLGTHINLEAACELGLIPHELKEKCVQIGNSSLKGAVMRCRNLLSEKRAAIIKSICSEVVLADEELFKTLYIENMAI